MIFFKRWPYLVRGGAIGFILYPALVILAINNNYKILGAGLPTIVEQTLYYLFFWPVGFFTFLVRDRYDDTPLGVVTPTQFIADFLLYFIIAILGLIVGAFIGWLYGKIKNRKVRGD